VRRLIIIINSSTRFVSSQHHVAKITWAFFFFFGGGARAPSPFTCPLPLPWIGPWTDTVGWAAVMTWCYGAIDSISSEHAVAAAGVTAGQSAVCHFWCGGRRWNCLATPFTNLRLLTVLKYLLLLHLLIVEFNVQAAFSGKRSQYLAKMYIFWSVSQYLHFRFQL